MVYFPKQISNYSTHFPLVVFEVYIYIYIYNIDVLCNISSKEHLPLKHVGVYAVYNAINLQICLCTC